MKATISCGDLSSHKLFVDVLAVQVAYNRLWYHHLEVPRCGIIPLLDGAAQGMVCNASHVQGFEHHGSLLRTLDGVVPKVDTPDEVLEEGRMEASLTQAVREGMADFDEVQLRARVASVANELGTHEAFDHMPRMA